MDQLDKSGWAPCFRPMEAKDQLKLHKTFSFRVKDANSGKHFVRLGDKGNTVWNYGNQISKRSAERGPRWATTKQRRDLTKGASRALGLPSQVIQELIDAFIVRRREQGKPRLRWRVSKGAKRSLGGVRFTNQDIDISRRGIVAMRSHTFRIGQHRDIEGKIASGTFSQDARGRWYCNIVCQVEPQTTNRTKLVGIDLGFQTVASAHNAPNLDQGSFYRDLEPKLAEAHRCGRKRQVRSIHAKSASRRKDALHNYSRAVVNDAGAVFVANIASEWPIKSGNAKATLDLSWATLRTLLKYKCDHAGVAPGRSAQSNQSTRQTAHRTP